MTVRIRPASLEDASDIRALHVASIRALGPRSYDEEQVAAWATKDDGPDSYPIGDDGHHFVVAEREQAIVAFGHVVPRAESVRAVYVHPDHVGSCVGSTVLAHLEGYALGCGTPRLGLWASLNAVGFYQRMGYRSVRDEAIEKSNDGSTVTIPVVEMLKSLRP